MCYRGKKVLSIWFPSIATAFVFFVPFPSAHLVDNAGEEDIANQRKCKKKQLFMKAGEINHRVRQPGTFQVSTMKL